MTDCLITNVMRTIDERKKYEKSVVCFRRKGFPFPIKVNMALYDRQCAGSQGIQMGTTSLNFLASGCVLTTGRGIAFKIDFCISVYIFWYHNFTVHHIWVPWDKQWGVKTQKGILTEQWLKLAHIYMILLLCAISMKLDLELKWG